MKTLKKFLLLAIVSCFFLDQPYAQKSGVEYTFLRNLAEHRTPGKDKFYRNVSKYNSPVSLAVPASLLVAGLINHDNSLKKKALFVTESIAGSQAITWAMKLTIRRDRPFVTDTTFKPVYYAKNKSFPSGHASEAFATATSLTILCPKWYVIVPSFGWATLVSYSRLYLGVHYPSDVIAGAIVGSGSALLSYKLNKWMHTSKADKLHKKKNS